MLSETLVRDPQLPLVSVFYTNSTHRDIAAALAERINLPLLENCDTGALPPFLLVVSEHPEHDYQLALRFSTENLLPILVNFQSQHLLYRQKFGGGRQQPIARALGLKKGVTPQVIDATAGFGRDAFVLASLGCHVHMLERHPVIHALLEDGLRRLAHGADTANPLVKALQLSYVDAREWLAAASQPVDIVYLDPMYPHRTKSALVKKEMRVLRQLVGDDVDVAALLETALLTARQRVVVKRPKTAPIIGAVTPSYCVESKNTRYDVYLTGLLKKNNS
ncbi:MAG: class I SAM-dependent methyltransferase [Gammaproteobacteria bacterium]|nr:class I SAM-dependent methyltransferase [Gammaproteobacteria bacterium]